MASRVRQTTAKPVGSSSLASGRDGLPRYTQAASGGGGGVGPQGPAGPVGPQGPQGQPGGGTLAIVDGGTPSTPATELNFRIDFGGVT